MVAISHVQPLQVAGDVSLTTMMAAMTQSDLWSQGDMGSVAKYLLSNRHLALPDDFKEVLMQGI